MFKLTKLQEYQLYLLSLLLIGQICWKLSLCLYQLINFINNRTNQLINMSSTFLGVMSLEWMKL